MPKLIIIAALMIGPFVPAGDQDGSTTRPAGERAARAGEDFSDISPAAVVEITSGDSIVIETRRGRFDIRLQGVQAGRDDEAGTSSARDFLKNLLSGEEVYLKYERPAHADEDPRRAYVFRAPDGLFVNAELIRQGYAAVDGTVESRHREQFEESERRARAAAKGIWSILRAAAEPASQAAASQPVATAPAVAASQPIGKSPPSHGSVGQTVYVTRSGAKYHRANCSFARKGATAILLQEALEKGLTPCTRCKP